MDLSANRLGLSQVIEADGKIRFHDNGYNNDLLVLSPCGFESGKPCCVLERDGIRRVYLMTSWLSFEHINQRHLESRLQEAIQPYGWEFISMGIVIINDDTYEIDGNHYLVHGNVVNG